MSTRSGQRQGVGNPEDRYRYLMPTTTHDEQSPCLSLHVLQVARSPFSSGYVAAMGQTHSLTRQLVLIDFTMQHENTAALMLYPPMHDKWSSDDKAE